MTPAADTISAVIPAYNAEAFLGRAIESALAQTRPPEDIVVVDDGSTDATAKVAERFGEPVRCIRQENAGPSAARNRGIREARGTHVAFLDADDEWLPGHLERAAECFAAHPELAWYAAAYKRFARNGRVWTDTVPADWLTDGAFLKDYLPAAGRRRIVHTDTVVVRRGVLLEVGGFDTRFDRGEDLDLWFRIGLRYPRLGYSRDVAAIYTPREESLTGGGGEAARSWLERVCHDDRLAREMGEEAARRAEPLLRRWAVHTIRLAVRQGDRGVIRDVIRLFDRRVPRVWRLVAAAYRVTPRALWRGVLGLWDMLRRRRAG